MKGFAVHAWLIIFHGFKTSLGRTFEFLKTNVKQSDIPKNSFPPSQDFSKVSEN